MDTQHRIPFRAGLFDWNGCMFDDVAVNYEFANMASRKFGNGRQLSFREYRENIALDYFRLYGMLGITPRLLHEKVSLERDRFMRKNWQRTGLRPGMRDLLAICKSLRLYTAIVSAEYPSLLLDRLDMLGIRKYLDAVFPKINDKETVFREICERQSIKNPRRAFYIDDTPDGVTCGKRAGLTTFGFINGHASSPRVEEAEPDYLVGTIAEMIPFVREGIAP